MRIREGGRGGEGKMSGDYGTVFVLPAGICGSLMKLQQPRDIAGALCNLRRTMSEVRETMDQRWKVKYSPIRIISKP